MLKELMYSLLICTSLMLAAGLATAAPAAGCSSCHMGSITHDYPPAQKEVMVCQKLPALVTYAPAMDVGLADLMTKPVLMFMPTVSKYTGGPTTGQLIAARHAMTGTLRTAPTPYMQMASGLAASATQSTAVRRY